MKERKLVAARLRDGLNFEKTYYTVPELSAKLGADNSEIQSAIRFGVLEITKFPVRGAKRFRIEESVAKTFARKFYAVLL